MKNERIIIAFLLVFAAVVLINLLRDEADMIPFESKRFWIVKTHSEKEFPVVFAGDSRIYRGISPDDFEDEFPGMKGVNLGYSAHGYHPRYLDFVDQRIDKDAEQPVIVFGISALPFCREGLEARNFFWEKNGRKKEQIIQYMHFYQLNRLFAPFDIMEILSGKKRRKADMNTQVTFHFNGWMESYQLKSDTTFYDERYSNAFVNNQYDSTGGNEFLRRVQDWSDEGITVVGFRTPASYTLQHLEDSLSGFSVPDFMKKFEQHGGYWIEVDRSKYETFDGNHLEHKSAVRFSRDLAKAIKRLLTSKGDPARSRSR